MYAHRLTPCCVLLTEIKFYAPHCVIKCNETSQVNQLFQAAYTETHMNQGKTKGTQKFPSFMRSVSYQPYNEAPHNSFSEALLLNTQGAELPWNKSFHPSSMPPTDLCSQKDQLMIQKINMGQTRIT